MAGWRRGRSDGGKNGGRRRNGSSQPSTSTPGDGEFSPDLESTIERLAQTARREVGDIPNALEAELFASEMTTLWQHHSLDELDAEKLLGLGLVNALERHPDAASLVVLRALAAVASEHVAGASGEAAERLSAMGVVGAPWLDHVGEPRPIEARVAHEDLFDDAETVFVEFEQPEPRHTIGVLIDHNLGGLARDTSLGGPLTEVEERLSQAGDERIHLDPIPLDEARARIEIAVERTEITLDPPVDEQFELLRALVGARLEALPPGGQPQRRPGVPTSERRAMLDDFLGSPEGEGLAEDAEVAAMAIDFCCDHVDGRPLRWSPVVVELFMVDWLPRQCAREAEFFERVPEVLRAWIRFAGRRRGIPAEAVEATVAGIAEWIEPMRTAARDEGSWGSAKAFAMAAQRAGVDLSDPAALEAFVDEYNAGLAAGAPGAEPPVDPG